MDWRKKTAEEKAERKEKRFNNLLINSTNEAYCAQITNLRTTYQQHNFNAFNAILPAFFDTFQKNLQYIIYISSLNQVEFCTIAGVSRNIVKKNQLTYISNLKLHTFLKIFALFLVYLPTLDFCDMFTLDFSETFPFLAEKREENRQKLGKKPRKKG